MNYDSISKEEYRQENINNVARELQNIGVDIMMHPEESYRPVNEVMVDVARALQAIREKESENIFPDYTHYKMVKESVMRSILGIRMRNEI